MQNLRMSRRNQMWALTFGIWLVGAYIIYVLYDMRFHNSFLDTTWDTFIYCGAGFYVFALKPIHDSIERAMPTEFIDIKNYELEVVYRSGLWEGGLYRKYDRYPKPTMHQFCAETRELLIAKATDAVQRLMAESWIKS